MIFDDKSFDHHVSRTSIPRDAGLEGDTQVVYTSDHGDNLGTRGLWGKSTFYEKSEAVPLIMAGLDIGHSVCDAPVDLLDLSVTITNHFDTGIPGVQGPKPLPTIAAEPTDPDRESLSQYHAIEAVSGSYMLVRGPWKLIHYVGFLPELLDLEANPEKPAIWRKRQRIKAF